MVSNITDQKPAFAFSDRPARLPRERACRGHSDRPLLHGAFFDGLLDVMLIAADCSFDAPEEFELLTPRI
jgi:hypothetical protein